MKISVIIPTLNERDCVRKAILSARDAQADQIVVCDGGSSDETIKIARELSCDIVESLAGRGQQLASGAKDSTGDVLVFLHADSVLGSDSLLQIRKQMQIHDQYQRQAESGLQLWGCFQHRIDSQAKRFRWVEKGNHWRTRRRGLVYGDQTLWVHRSLYESVGGFPDVPMMEDVRISEALRKKSCPVILPGPVTISARHWKRRGVLRTTLRNQMLMGLYRCGCSPDRIAAFYRR